MLKSANHFVNSFIVIMFYGMHLFAVQFWLHCGNFTLGYRFFLNQSQAVTSRGFAAVSKPR
jgi:hypothetical protein